MEIPIFISTWKHAQNYWYQHACNKKKEEKNKETAQMSISNRRDTQSELQPHNGMIRNKLGLHTIVQSLKMIFSLLPDKFIFIIIITIILPWKLQDSLFKKPSSFTLDISWCWLFWHLHCSFRYFHISVVLIFFFEVFLFFICYSLFFSNKCYAC